MENFVQQFFFENINYESTQLSQQKAHACAEEGCSASLCLQERFEESHWKLAQADGEGMWKMWSHFPHKLWIGST